MAIYRKSFLFIIFYNLKKKKREMFEKKIKKMQNN